ncbi:pyridoxal phosphate-dependent aminotransferase [Actinomadura harenae]|uniref:Aminotransferase n=1 Tax=Actinomadura harenae TaxID=2483351 RepID=A0A3M2MJF8_9ACTN|nr:pyridoxal phosphate-dependent aminotransferase [Actinomadura harenae]RMI47498.1 pyridoxal phosphate-dependent aminotransferase [Actinomadura harenae]
MIRSRMAPNLKFNQVVDRLNAAGADILNLAFGESRLPLMESLAELLSAAAYQTTYGPVAGTQAVRDAAAGYFGRRRLPTDPERVIVAPGSKPLLMAVQHAVPGDCILPQPCWNSYAPQARLAGKTPISVPITRRYGGVPDPLALRAAIRTARARGLDPRLMILTVPDTPTGTVASPETVRAVCAIAEDEDLIVVSDEIYRDIIHDPGTELLSPAEIVPHRTVVTTGLSKSLALGGWRIGAARFPVGERGDRIQAGVMAVASEVWSTLAHPMQEAADYAFGDPPDVRQRLEASARLHGAVARAMHSVMVGAGALCRPPTGAFYVYPDFEPMRTPLAALGVTDSRSLQRFLFDEYDIAVFSGHLLGDDPDALRFRAATSMLYGPTVEDQTAALASADPVNLPHIRKTMTRVETALAHLRSRCLEGAV